MSDSLVPGFSDDDEDEEEPQFRRRRVGDRCESRYPVTAGRHPAPEHRFLRGLVDFFADTLGEALLTGVSLALFAGVSAAAVYGWHHDKLLVLGIGVAFVLFLGYGITQLFRSRRERDKPRWPRIAAAAVITLVVISIWASYILSYR